jgi:GntR family transcriptional regulator/MocR family aminotransferase
MLIDLQGRGPLSHRLYAALRRAILHGDLPAGARLPSTRALAVELAVSRKTVLLAYGQLLEEGYAVGRRGSGTFVPRELPDDGPWSRHDGPRVRAKTSRAPRASKSRPDARLSRVGRTIRYWRTSWAPDGSSVPFDFRYGRPGLDFPLLTWRRVLARRLRRLSLEECDYGSPRGSEDLRDAIASYLQRSRGVICSPEQVLIVRGSQQALDLAQRGCFSSAAIECCSRSLAIRARAPSSPPPECPRWPPTSAATATRALRSGRSRASIARAA